MFKTTPVFKAIYDSPAKVIILQGGTSSSKSISALQENILYAVSNKNKVITVTAESIPNLRKGAYRDTEWLYSTSEYFRSQVKFWNKSDRIIYFKNGSIMEFISNQDEQGAKAGKRDRLFVDEAQSVPWNIFFQLAIRTRDKVIIAYNPSIAFWAHEKLIGTSPQSNDLSATVQLIISDHRHNTFLSEEDHRKIEGIKDPELWAVYARGKTGNLTGLIFPEWKMIPNDQYPKDAPFTGGLDFGYTNDPTAGVKAAKIGNKIFLDEICYEAGLGRTQIKSAFEVEGFTHNHIIFCDHDPEQIRQLRKIGLNCIQAKKGADSIVNGIYRLKEFDVYYTERSKNLHIEKSKYMWMKDPVTSKSTNVPIDDYCHLIDAVRYSQSLRAAN